FFTNVNGQDDLILCGLRRWLYSSWPIPAGMPLQGGSHEQDAQTGGASGGTGAQIPAARAGFAGEPGLEPADWHARFAPTTCRGSPETPGRDPPGAPSLCPRSPEPHRRLDASAG